MDVLLLLKLIIMNPLKQIPIRYKGELHDIRLVNFSIEMEEAKKLILTPLPIRNFNGRAMISMVDVKLRKMRPSFFPESISFNYRHIAFRVLVNDTKNSDQQAKGIFFHRSFTNNRIITLGGSIMTDYNLENAQIKDTKNKTTLQKGNQKIEYITGSKIQHNLINQQLKTDIASLDRAYAKSGNTLRVTSIQREKWPIEEVEILDYKNSFFETAKPEGAFKVYETIYYQWLPPKPVQL
jgi:hypothetical protein